MIDAMGGLGSEASSIIHRLGVDRQTIKAVMKELSSDRSAQVTLSSILCATRFKCFDNTLPGVLQPTHCRICNKNEQDSFEHMIECVGLRNIPEHKEFLVDYLKELAKRANVGNPGYPVKYVAAEELFLENYSDSSVDEICF